MKGYGGYPRFQYRGFWFGFMDPWPEYWSNDWYDNDDVYIVYSDDGYYLYNRRYPRDRIAIMVYVNELFIEYDLTILASDAGSASVGQSQVLP
jgi:hypothetical protein